MSTSNKSRDIEKGGVTVTINLNQFNKLAACKLILTKKSNLDIELSTDSESLTLKIK